MSVIKDYEMKDLEESLSEEEGQSSQEEEQEQEQEQEQEHSLVSRDEDDIEDDDVNNDGEDEDKEDRDIDRHGIIPPKVSTKPGGTISSGSRPGTPPPLEIPHPDGTEKGQFLHDLYSYMTRIGQPITKVPHLGYQELDLYKLYQLVIKRGGMDEVTRRQEWKTVYQELGIPTMSTSASYNTRTNYKKHLYLYELEHCDFNERRPPGAEPKYEIGEYVRIVSSNYEGKVFYARVVKCRWRNHRNMYYIHYNGWSNSHDEWMPESVLGKLLSEETRRPNQLGNPPPTRSSKSNHIIGEPIVTKEPKTPKHRRQPSSTKRYEDEYKDYNESASDEEYYRPAQGSTKSTGSTPPSVKTKASPAAATAVEEGRKRGLRLKLRHRHQQDSGSSSTTQLAVSGPNINTIQAEMQKLEAERFLEYIPPKNPKFLSADNLHTFNLGKNAAPLRADLLQSVDLRVPSIEELVGKPPFEPSSPLGLTEASLRGTKKPKTSTGRNDSIAAMEHELRTIRREYKQTKKLLNLYYGPSDQSSDSGSSGSPPLSNNSRLMPPTTRKTRNQRV